jgi:hypothetical protein
MPKAPQIACLGYHGDARPFSLLVRERSRIMHRREAGSSATCLARNCFESRNETDHFARNDPENASRGQRIRQKVESLM